MRMILIIYTILFKGVINYSAILFQHTSDVCLMLDDNLYNRFNDNIFVMSLESYNHIDSQSYLTILNND